jgi:hypothetical protein
MESAGLQPLKAAPSAAKIIFFGLAEICGITGIHALQIAIAIGRTRIAAVLRFSRRWNAVAPGSPYGRLASAALIRRALRSLALSLNGSNARE